MSPPRQMSPAKKQRTTIAQLEQPCPAEVEKAKTVEELFGGKAKDVVFEGENAFGDGYRNYEDSKRQSEVSKVYREMHEQQTVAFGQRKREEWLGLNKGEFSVMEVITMLDELIDDSDPDNELPNSIHDFQTAERIREAWPEHDWFHLTGLIHDMGKFMALGERAEPQWAVVGDTFPVGCEFSQDAVFPESFQGNPDSRHPVYSTKNGIYEEHCGLENLMMSWGHDEYMYWVLKKNGCTLPQEALDMIRYHSFYPWHNKGAYSHLTTKHDEEVTKKWVLEFNRFDLYSKGDAIPDVPAVAPYYKGLLEKYGISGKLKW